MRMCIILFLSQNREEGKRIIETEKELKILGNNLRVLHSLRSLSLDFIW